MPKYEQRVCNYCGSTFNGPRIVHLSSGDFVRWQVLQQEIDDLDHRERKGFKVVLFSFMVVVSLPLIIMSIVSVLTDVHEGLLFVSGMGGTILSWLAGLKWLFPWHQRRYSIDNLRDQQDKILAAAGYNLEELKHHRHGYVVEEK